MKSCNEKDEEDELFHIDTLYIERFYIELNDPISCSVIGIAETFCPNYPFQPVCFTSLQFLIIPTATSQSAQCYISKIEPLICPQQHRCLKNREENEGVKVKESEREKQRKSREKSSILASTWPRVLNILTVSPSSFWGRN